MTENEAKEIITKECKKHYNNGECFTKCRCRDGLCKGTTKDNKWNIELAEKLLKESEVV